MERLACLRRSPNHAGHCCREKGLRISLLCVPGLSANAPHTGYVEEEEVFMTRANIESGFGQYLCSFPPSLLFAPGHGEGQEARSRV